MNLSACLLGLLSLCSCFWCFEALSELSESRLPAQRDCKSLRFSVEGRFKKWARKERKMSRQLQKCISKTAEKAPPLPLQVNGIFPSLAATASSGPIRSECGTGALMPWADRLYMVSYLSLYGGGSGAGLYAIYPNFTMETVAEHNSTFANRIIHRQTNQIVIGAWLVDVHGRVKVLKQLLRVRIAATAEHLTEPDTKVYMLGMDGPLWECHLISLKCTQLFDLVDELHIPRKKGEQPHFKAAHTMNGRLVVASNTFEEADFDSVEHGGRLAEWHGPGTNWTILERTAFVEVTGRRNFGKVIYALGWDYRSVILKVFDGRNPKYSKWQTYRLPKGSHAFDHLWQTEWPRIREVETERYLMDMHGIFYELSPLGWAGSTWGLNPVSRHLRVVPDFTSFRGMLVLGGNQISSIFDNNVVTGQAQSGLWFGKTDDLWSFGRPQGWGAVWRNDTVCDGDHSDPFLMNGFQTKVAHYIERDCPKNFYSAINIEIDITGAAGHRNGDTWVRVIDESWKGTRTPDYNYNFYVFNEGFSAQWARFTFASRDSYYGRGDSKKSKEKQCCTVTAYFVYT